MMKFIWDVLFFFRSASAVTVIPAANGTYGVGTTAIALTDNSRLDPFALTPENRSVVISVFYPVEKTNECDWKLVPYLPEGTAAFLDQEYAPYGVPKGAFESFRLKLCSQTSSPSSRADDSQAILGSNGFPLVVFSPGLGNSRLLYSAMAQSVASHGFTVVTIDHPYDADVVEFPDGKLVYSNIKNLTQAIIDLDLETRVKDVSFVIDELSKWTVIEELLPKSYWNHGFDTKHVAMYGHSLGGATAALAMMNDSRIIGGINLDGGLFGSVVQKGLKDPFVLFGRDTNDTTPTWDEIWPHLGWKLQLLLEDSQHGTFSDLPLLATLLGYDPLPPELAGLLGTLPAARGRQTISTYVAAFMETVLKKETSVLLDGPSKAFPEVVFVRSEQ